MNEPTPAEEQLSSPDSKPFWQSKTLIGLIVLLVGPYVAKYLPGVDNADLADLVGKVLQIVGLGLGIYGRVKAVQPLHVLPVPPGNTGPSDGPPPSGLAMLALLLCAGAASMGLISCASSKPATPTIPAPPVTDYVAQATSWAPIIETLSTAATGAALQFGVQDKAERQQIADQIYAVSHGVWTLTDGTVPKPDELKTYVLAFGGSDSTAGAVSLTSAISGIYATYYATIGGNPKAAIIVLSALARGAESAAAAYVTPTPSVVN